MFRIISGNDLKRMRLSCNRTTANMANRAGVTRQTYEKYEAGTSNIRLEEALVLMIYCKVDINPLTNHFAELKKKFSQYKEQVHDNKPNSYRASANKDHLKPQGTDGNEEINNE